MFGHQDEPATQPTDDNGVQSAQSPVAATEEPQHDGVLDGSGAMSAPADPMAMPDPSPAASSDTDSDMSSSYVATDEHGQPDTTTPLPPVPAASAGDDNLLTLKQQALQQLSPLVGHLDQTPEEKFHTTMMMIQAADNQALIKDAYEAALAIPDEKTRAQALLDIINEINYFTQHNADSDE